MKRLASEVLGELEIRVARLEKSAGRKPLLLKFPDSPIFWERYNEEQGEKAYKKAFKKNLRSFLIKLEEIVEEEIALEDIGLGDDYLERALRKSDFYFDEGLEEILKEASRSAGIEYHESDFYRGDYSLRNRIHGDPMRIILRHTWEEFYGGFFGSRDNQKFITKTVNELLDWL